MGAPGIQRPTVYLEARTLPAMNDPLIREIRRVRAQRARELARDLERALDESDARLFTWGHDVIDCSRGEPRLVFAALRKPPADSPDK